MNYAITQKSLEQLEEEGERVTYLWMETEKGLLPARFMIMGRNYEEAVANMMKAYASTAREYRDSLREKKGSILGICEQESKILRDLNGDEVIIIRGRLMAIRDELT